MELKRDRNTTLRQLNQLLIVPYGIETTVIHKQHAYADSFNRTLWN